MKSPFQRPAMVFAHYPHEVLATGMLLRFQPHLLFVTNGKHNAKNESLVRRGLEAIDFKGTVNFLAITEVEIYQRVLAGDSFWFAALRNQLTQWLVDADPDVIFTDAWEGYNSVHDLAPLLTHAAIRRLPAAQFINSPQQMEIPLAMHSLDSGLEDLYQSMSRTWCIHQLTSDEIRKKRLRCELLIEDSPQDLSVADHPVTVLGRWTSTQFETEFYRPVPVDRSWLTPPARNLWKTYDQQGLERVQEGRYQTALTFAGHIAPLARDLLKDSDDRQFHDKAA